MAPLPPGFPAAAGPAKRPARLLAISDAAELAFALLAGAAAFLAFVLQPLASRELLPATGGSAAAWTVGQLFFLLAVLAGYGAALWLGHRMVPARAVGATGVILAAWAALALYGGRPVGLALGSGPLELAILAALAVGTGLPAGALFALSPLLGRWHAELWPGRAYRLWVPGNLGSLFALAAYPLWLEPAVDLSWQGSLWAAAVLLLGLGLLRLAGRQPGAAGGPLQGGQGALAASSRRPGVAAWVSWSAISGLMVAISLSLTNFLAIDVSAGPLVWSGPLAVFLAAFALAFSGWRRAQRMARALAPWGVLALGAISLSANFLPLLVEWVGLLAAWAVLAAGLAGALADRRPSGPFLAHFSAATGLGGAAAGALVGIAAPRLLDRPAELPLSILVAAIFLGADWFGRRRHSLIDVPGLRRAAGAAGVVVPLTLCATIELMGLSYADQAVLWRGRSQWSAYSVRAQGVMRLLTSGSTVHGLEVDGPDGRPLGLAAYYWGLPALLASLDGRRLARRQVGVIGLGVGTAALLADGRTCVTFYEIDPLVEQIARSRFGYLGAAPPGALQVVIGDGRYALSAPPGGYDLLLGDAYSSDAVPVHTLTLEALRAEAATLRPGGLLAIHVSNRHLDLARLLGRAARVLGWRGWDWRLNPGADDPAGRLLAQWVLLWPWPGREPPILAALPGTISGLADDGGPAWTDQRSPLLWALR